MGKPVEDMKKFVRKTANKVFLQEAFDSDFEAKHPRGQGGQFRSKGWYRGRYGEWRGTSQGGEYFVPEDITPEETEGLLSQISMGVQSEHFEGEDIPGYDEKTKKITNKNAFGQWMNQHIEDAKNRLAGEDDMHAEPYGENEPPGELDSFNEQDIVRIKGIFDSYIEDLGRAKDDTELKFLKEHYRQMYPLFDWDIFDKEQGF